MELSEPITAAWLSYSKTELHKIASIKSIDDLAEHEGGFTNGKLSLKKIIGDKKGKFQKAISSKIIYGGAADKNIAVKAINNVLNGTASGKQYDTIVNDTVKGLSAAIAIYDWMDSGRHKKTSSKKIKQVYITGGTWHANIAKFNVKVPGMQAYNSSDLVIEKEGKKFFGVSLKKKAVTEGSPTLINNSVAEVLKTFKEADTKHSKLSVLDDVDLIRIKFIGEILISKGFAEVLNKGSSGISKIDLGYGGPSSTKRKATNKADKGSFTGPRGLAYIKQNQTQWKSKLRNKNATPKQLHKDVVLQKPHKEYNYKQKDKAWIDIDGFRNPFAAEAGIDSFGKTGTVRAYVNRQYGDKEGDFWQALKKTFTVNSQEVRDVSYALASRVLKFQLPEELHTALKKDKYHFGFALVTGIGDFNLKKNVFRVRKGYAQDVHTIICTLAEIHNGEGKAQGDYRIVWDNTKNKNSKKANIWLKLVRGKIPILNMEIRYKGGFTSWPQFFATLSDEFTALLGNGHCIT